MYGPHPSAAFCLKARVHAGFKKNKKDARVLQHMISAWKHHRL